MVFRFYSKVLSKCRKCHFRDPKFKYFLAENPPGPPYICHHFVGAQMFFSHQGPHTRSAATGKGITQLKPNEAIVLVKKLNEIVVHVKIKPSEAVVLAKNINIYSDKNL